MQDRFQVGVISSTHGVAGEVKVFPTTDDVKRFKKLKHVILDTGKEELELEITQVKFFKQMVILKFREFSNINEVERFRGKSLYVTRENAVKLQKDEYFIADMIGMRVVTTDGEELGTLQDVMQTGANDVYVVEKKNGEELLLPAIHDCVKLVDMEQGVITVYLMPGLRDL
ncbi:MAG: ribosome maturation factor RimM [Clostridiales bacterium]|nr:ribosome maturation factor RimM [Clostridiales bacterium]